MVNRLSAYIIHNGGQTTIDSRKNQIFCHNFNSYILKNRDYGLELF